jgi:hypothetical protein
LDLSAKSAIKIETKKEPMDENDIEDVKDVSEIVIKQGFKRLQFLNNIPSNLIKNPKIWIQTK